MPRCAKKSPKIIAESALQANGFICHPADTGLDADELCKGAVALDGGADALMAGAPLHYKLHILRGFMIFLISPFIRMIHIWKGVDALFYLFRPYQSVRPPHTWTKEPIRSRASLSTASRSTTPQGCAPNLQAYVNSHVSVRSSLPAGVEKLDVERIDTGIERLSPKRFRFPPIAFCTIYDLFAKVCSFSRSCFSHR
jgi:hypothetical protein